MGGRRGKRSFADFEREVQRLTRVLSERARERARGEKKRRGPAAGRRPRPYISRVYQADRARAARDILEERPPPCPIPPEELHRHFSAVFGRADARGGPRPARLPALPRLDAHPCLGQDFSPREVDAMLRRTRNTSSPGPDQIRFDVLKEWEEEEGGALADIFEECRRFGRTPAGWKRAKTSLLFKQGDPNEPSNWRPLMLCNTMSKLYAKCLAGRVSQWAQEGNALSPQQKGFQAQEGCAEHLFLLQSVLCVARCSKTECAMAFLDIADAYGSIPRCHVFETLAEFGMPEGFLGLLRELYQGCTATIKVRHSETPEIPLRTGLKQGCPLSPILFQLAIEPLLRFIGSRPRGFSLYGAKVCLLAYADDLVLVAENAGELQAMLDEATAAANWIGLRFKAGKCKSLHYSGGTRQLTEFRVQNEVIACLKEEEKFQYLGASVGFQNPPETLCADFVASLNKIKESRLTLRQKVSMVTGTLLPRTLSVLRDRPVPEEVLRSIDSELSMWGHYNQKGTQLTVQELGDVEVVSHTFLLLSSPDRVVKAVARGALGESFTGNPDLEELASYLSGSQDQHGDQDPTSLWARTRHATQRIGKLVQCQWICNGDELCLKVAKGVIYPGERRTLAGTLKRAMGKKKQRR